MFCENVILYLMFQIASDIYYFCEILRKNAAHLGECVGRIAVH
jgi:hypothetical protein